MEAISDRVITKITKVLQGKEKVRGVLLDPSYGLANGRAAKRRTRRGCLGSLLSHVASRRLFWNESTVARESFGVAEPIRVDARASRDNWRRG